MRQFLTVVFGGLAIVAVGIGIAWSAGQAWKFVSPSFAGGRLSLASVVDAISPGDIGGTIVDGFRRAIRYTANEEEDLVNSVINALFAEREGKITADAYLLKDLSSNIVLAEHNSETLLPVASLTKLVTAVVSRRLIDPDDKIVITPEIMQTYGNTAEFKAGEVFSASDLLYPLLMVSSNDAAEAYAHYYGRKAFIAEMNEFAQSVGAYRTYFADPSGLSDLNISTATDMSVILDWIRENDEAVIGLTAMKSKTIRNHTWVNPAHFLSWSYYQGGKNGFTDGANRTSASLFTLGKESHTFALVLLGSENRDADAIKLINKVR